MSQLQYRLIFSKPFGSWRCILCSHTSLAPSSSCSNHAVGKHGMLHYSPWREGGRQGLRGHLRLQLF
jgi:hypothetical protein